MRFSAKALVIVSAILWGAGVLLVGLINLAAPSYGSNFLHGLSSVYPGFHASRTVPDVLVGTGYAIVAGAVAGYVFAVLYNFFVPRVEKA
jgi:phosphotransferase system  glucose/maltose/N-acetylglucosamine-specific IIC component